MSKIDTSPAWWQAKSGTDSITNTDWNNVRDDITTAMNGVSGEATDGNVASSALIPANIDGTALTQTLPTGGSSPQLVTYQTRFDNWIDGGRKAIVVTTLWDTVADTRPDVNDIPVSVIDNQTGGAVTVTGLLFSAVAPPVGSVVELVLAGADNVTLEHGTDEADFDLEGGVDYVHVATSGRPSWLRFVYTDLDGYLTDAVWVETSRRTP